MAVWKLAKLLGFIWKTTVACKLIFNFFFYVYSGLLFVDVLSISDKMHNQWLNQCVLQKHVMWPTVPKAASCENKKEGKMVCVN